MNKNILKFNNIHETSPRKKSYSLKKITEQKSMFRTLIFIYLKKNCIAQICIIIVHKMEPQFIGFL